VAVHEEEEMVPTIGTSKKDKKDGWLVNEAT